MITIKLTGAQRLLKRIEKAKNEKALYRIATREAAKVVAAQIKQDLPKLTGDTAKAVRVRGAGRGKLGAKIICGQGHTDTYKAWWLERGTKDRVQTKTHRATGHITAGHYVVNALSRLRGRVVSIMRGIFAQKVWQE